MPNATVGRNLQKAVTLTLNEPAPDEGVQVTVRSGDPARLRISKEPDQAGAESLVIRIRQGYRQSQEFWLQAVGGDGAVTYTATAPGFGTGTGTVTLSPAAVVIRGPLGAPKFITTPGSAPQKVSAISVRLDASLEFAEEQAIAGGTPVRIDVISSNPSVGTVANSQLEMRGGTNIAATQFRPVGEGETTLSIHVPPGFSTPAQLAGITATVKKPGLAISDQLVIGQNLQLGGVLSLGEAPPAEGLTVTIVSEDPTKFLLSTSATEVGSKSVQVKLAHDEVSGRYYVQALGGSGTFTYTASAPGFRSRTAEVSLAPSGIVITPAEQGPPDEAHVLRKEAPESISKFTADLSRPEPSHLIAWTVQLDPVTHRSADITVQPLRAGVTITVPLRNSNPAVGTIVPQVTIPGGSDHAAAEFKPVTPGETEISVTAPKDFTQSANSTTVLAVVRK